MHAIKGPYTWDVVEFIAPRQKFYSKNISSSFFAVLNLTNSTKRKFVILEENNHGYSDHIIFENLKISLGLRSLWKHDYATSIIIEGKIIPKNGQYYNRNKNKMLTTFEIKDDEDCWYYIYNVKDYCIYEKGIGYTDFILGSKLSDITLHNYNYDAFIYDLTNIVLFNTIMGLQTNRENIMLRKYFVSRDEDAKYLPLTIINIGNNKSTRIDPEIKRMISESYFNKAKREIINMWDEREMEAIIKGQYYYKREGIEIRNGKYRKCREKSSFIKKIFYNKICSNFYNLENMNYIEFMKIL